MGSLDWSAVGSQQSHAFTLLLFICQNKSCGHGGLPVPVLMTKKQEGRLFKGHHRFMAAAAVLSFHCGLTGVFTYAKLILAALASDKGGYYARSLNFSDSLGVLGP